MDAIIFLAPLSSFDQTLVEDSSVNRLVSFSILWKEIVFNALLHRRIPLCFGSRCVATASSFIARWSYSWTKGTSLSGNLNREFNLVPTSARIPLLRMMRNLHLIVCVSAVCFGYDLIWVGQTDMRKKFESLHKQYSPAPRQFYCHLTSLMVNFCLCLPGIWP